MQGSKERRSAWQNDTEKKEYYRDTTGDAASKAAMYQRGSIGPKLAPVCLLNSRSFDQLQIGSEYVNV